MNEGPGRMIMAMGGIGLLAGVLIVAVFQVTSPTIERKKRAALERAVFEVLPGAERMAAFSVRSDGTLSHGDASGERLYACYDAQGKLLGVAISAQGQGYQDVIRLIYGYSPDRGRIVGLKILESKETPGLGDKIETDPAFRENFRDLEAGRPIELVKPGQKTEPFQMEAITGATISSRAVERILRESTARLLPIVARNLEVLRKGGRP